MDSRDLVIIEYSGMPDGWAQSGLICPECGGGSKKESSLRVSANNGWLNWRCYRDSCKFHGGYPTNKRGVRTHVDKKPKQYYTPLCSVDLPKELVTKFTQEFHIEEGMLEWAQWWWCPNYKGEKRVRMPILGPDGRPRADTWRSYHGAEPKGIITKRADDAITTCWYRAGMYGKTLVIVEDQPSALRVCGANVDALALCGTLITPDRVEEIRKQDYDNVYLCLDRDATVTAIQSVVAFRERFKRLHVKALTKDVKNMSPGEFHKFIEEL